MLIDFQRKIYQYSGTPTSNFDGVDTAGIGHRFLIGDSVQDTSSEDKDIWICKSNTTTSGIWEKLAFSGEINHINLIGLQGGSVELEEFYHLTQTELTKLQNDDTPSSTRIPSSHGTTHTSTDIIPDATISGSGLMSPSDKVKLDGISATSFSTTSKTYGDSPYSASAWDCVLADPTSGNIVVILPTPSAGTLNKQICIKRINSSSNMVTISGTVDGGSNIELSRINEVYTLIGTASSWWII